MDGVEKYTRKKKKNLLNIPDGGSRRDASRAPARAAHRNRNDGYNGQFLRVNTRPIWIMSSVFDGHMSMAVTAVIRVDGCVSIFV